MRGIVILNLSKDSEPTIDAEFPEGIIEELQISLSGLESLCEQHKNVKTGPNYLEMQIKRNVSVASFFTGHSQRSFLGIPEHAITIFLSDDDILPRTFDGQVRRIAFELLPKKEESDFYEQFVKAFDLLKKGELDPYYQQMLEMEQDLSTKKERIDDLAQKVSMLVSDRSDHLRNVDALKDEINGLYVKMDSWSAQMAELNEYNASLTLKIKELTQSTTRHKNDLRGKDEEIAKLSAILNEKAEIEDGAEKLLEQIKLIRVENENLRQEIEKGNETNKKLKFQILKAKREIDTHLETITNLKLSQRNIQKEISSGDNVKQKIKDELLELKKELKVVRRERDHYQGIVKKNKLF